MDSALLGETIGPLFTGLVFAAVFVLMFTSRERRLLTGRDHHRIAGATNAHTCGFLKANQHDPQVHKIAVSAPYRCRRAALFIHSQK